jgi:hypothetical protein
MCTADNDTLPVTLANFTDNDCECSWLNATFILTRSPFWVCRWEYFANLPCQYGYGGTLYFGIIAVATIISGQSGWDVRVYIGRLGNNDEIHFRWVSGGFAPFDCTATRNLTWIIASYMGQQCGPWDYIGITCQVN